MSLWRNHDYVRWFVGDTSSQFTTALRLFAVPLVAFGLTHSTAQAGLLGTATSVVGLVAGIPGGVLIDRMDRRRAMCLYALLGSLVWGAAALLLIAGRLTFGALALLAVAGAVVSGLFEAASNAALRSLLTTEEFPGATATNQGRDAAVQLAASPLSGLLYGLMRWMPFAATLLGYALLAASALRIRADLRPGPHEEQSPLRDLVDGIAWCWGARVMRTLAMVAMLINFGLNGAMYTFQFALLQRGVSPTLIGYLDSALAASILIGSLAAGRVVHRLPAGRIAIVGLSWTALSLLPAAFSQDYRLLLACLGLMGFVLPAINAAIGGYFFAVTPTALQGRANAIFMTACMSMTALSPATAGLMLQHTTPALTVPLFVATMALAAALALGSRDVRAIPTPDRWQAENADGKEQRDDQTGGQEGAAGEDAQVRPAATTRLDA